MNMHAMTGAYDQYWRKLYDNGYSPLPIIPDTKTPGVLAHGEWRKMVGWQDPNRRMIETPQPGAGLAVRTGKQHSGSYLIAIDLDDDAVAVTAMDVLPLAVAKIGARGNTIFLRSDKPIASRNFCVKGAVKAQILSDGRQTVIPPTVHPDTKRPYAWETESTLFNTPLTSLPTSPDNLVELILQAIAGAGFTADPVEEPKAAPEAGYDEGSPYAELNALALNNLPKWVPDLNLYKFRRERGYQIYSAVATWRESTEGRSPEDREPNLRITSKGIKDWGTNKGYSPIDLVMAARGCDRSAAYDWLAERVKLRDDVEVDFDKIKESAEASPGDAVVTDDTNTADAAGAEKGTDFSLLGRAWRFGDVLPKREPMLVQKLIPAAGYGYIAGQWGTFKTFVISSLGVAVAGGGTFAGQDVVKRGAVIMVELEGSNSEARITAAAQAAQVGGALPIALLTDDPPKIIFNGVLNPQFKRYCNQLIAYGKKLAEEHGVPLSLITIDPQNKVAGFKDEQSSAEAQVVADAWSYLAATAGCAVVIVDHYGKNHGAGLRGSSSKETNAHFILGTSEQAKNVFASRYLEVRKQRNGISGVCTDFAMQEYTVTMKQKSGGGGIEDVDVSTLVIEWEGGLHPIDEVEEKPTPKAKTEEKSMTQKALDVLRDLIASPDLRVAHGEPPGGYAARTGGWLAAFKDTGALANNQNPGNRFSQIRASLRNEGMIGEDAVAGVSWIALPGTT